MTRYISPITPSTSTLHFNKLARMNRIEMRICHCNNCFTGVESQSSKGELQTWKEPKFARGKVRAERMFHGINAVVCEQYYCLIGSMLTCVITVKDKFLLQFRSSFRPVCENIFQNHTIIHGINGLFLPLTIRWDLMSINDSIFIKKIITVTMLTDLAQQIFYSSDPEVLQAALSCLVLGLWW